MNLQNWKTQLRKGFLDLCILNCLSRRSYYGYDLVQDLKRIEALQMREGTIYPILARLEEDGLVASSMERSSSGPPRKVFRITRTGRGAAGDMNAHWQQLIAAVGLARRGPDGEKS